MRGDKNGRSAGLGKLITAAACGFLAAKLWPPSAPRADDFVEVGAAGADLRYWRAKEALRHGELRLGVQAAAIQAQEARATAMLGWSVAGVLALGAAAANGTYAIPAGLAALCLLTATLLCIYAIRTLTWSGPGYRPEIVFNDRSGTELEMLESLVIGYQEAVQSNHNGFQRYIMLLYWALLCIVIAPAVAAAAFVFTQYQATAVHV